MKHGLSLLFCLFVLLLGGPVQAGILGEDSAKADEKPALVTLMPLYERVAPGEDLVVGIVMDLKPGWHTYWKNPGSAGKGIDITWDLPNGVTGGGILYTRPKILRTVIEAEEGKEVLESYGYTGKAVYFARFHVSEKLVVSSLELSGKLKFGICAEQCTLQRDDLSLTVPLGKDPGAPNGFLKPRFDALPPAYPGKAAGFEAVIPNVTLPAGGKTEVSLKFRSTGDENLSFDPPDAEEAEHGFFPDANEELYAGIPVLGKDGVVRFSLEALEETPLGTMTLKPLVAVKLGSATKVYELTLPVTVTKGGPSSGAAPGEPEDPEMAQAELPPVAGTVPPAPEPPGAANAASPAFPVLLLMAFFGGMLLNLMPCVLPVLSIKVLGFVQDAQAEHHSPFIGALMYMAGVVLSFLALGGVLIGLSKAGQAVGWGFQFQNPFFVLFMGVVLLVFALNLFGLFEIQFSGGTGASQLASKKGLAGSFFSGVLATTLATPCTAPLLSPVLGLALSSPGSHTLVLLGTMGAGLAAPYLVVSASPSLLRLVPKPGPWMIRFRQFMGLLLLGVLLALIWLMGQLWPGEGLLMMLGVLFLVGAGVWFWSLAGQGGNLVWRGAAAAMAVLAIGWVLADRPDPRSSSPAGQLVTESGWKPFSEKNLAALRSRGKTVFVDFTADWCLTCKVNHVRVLDRAAFYQLTRKYDVELMVADYTRQPESLTRVMKEYGRSAVPLYLVYPPQESAKTLVLPEVLTIGDLEKAFEQAKTVTALKPAP